MALVVITVSDTPEGHADVGVLCEPALPSDPEAVLTSAQQIALTMLHAARNSAQVEQDNGLAQLIEVDGKQLLDEMAEDAKQH